jgi:hypothetical protein
MHALERHKSQLVFFHWTTASAIGRFDDMHSRVYAAIQ